MYTDLTSTLQEFETKLKGVKSQDELEDLRVEYLGRNGVINTLLGEIKNIDAEKRKEYGAEVNRAKNLIETEVKSYQTKLNTSANKVDFDTSVPGIAPRIGHLHPTTQVIRRMNSFFRRLGYSVYEGPEIETDEYCFEKLNLPKDHPARELTDTLYIRNPEILLRVHTSSVETRAMTQEKLPIRIVVPGKVYRNETPNATNSPMFYQYEGLVVDEGISMADLKGTLTKFAQFLYGENVVTRFRCKYYPQVEPGAGMDIQCSFCSGKGCGVCKYRGFIEVLGSGMVHPNVLKACGINSEKYTGFAFGMGLDRLVMLEYGIKDIRRLYDGSLVYAQ